MQLRCLLLIYSLVVTAIAAATYQKIPAEEPNLTRKPLKGTTYEVEKLPGNVPDFRLYGKGYMGGQQPLARVIYRRTGLSKKPVLNIWAVEDISSQDPATMISLPTIIKGLTFEETNVKLDRVPYVTFEDFELEGVAIDYANDKQKGVPRPFTVAKSTDYEYWTQYQRTYAFQTVAELFRPRKIKEIKS
ncbi:hypothetical protein LZ31DRAFT_544679 [Colletotrichum somersetense]|nr:hypothetical protein LZ31DRAFT_544679 [Colletotrichum somersetense]